MSEKFGGLLIWDFTFEVKEGKASKENNFQNIDLLTREQRTNKKAMFSVTEKV